MIIKSWNPISMIEAFSDEMSYIMMKHKHGLPWGRSSWCTDCSEWHATKYNSTESIFTDHPHKKTPVMKQVMKYLGVLPPPQVYPLRETGSEYPHTTAYLLALNELYLTELQEDLAAGQRDRPVNHVCQLHRPYKQTVSWQWPATSHCDPQVMS